MTRPPEDPPQMWFKQVPNNRITADGTWSTRLLEAHHTVRRARQPDHGDATLCECGEKGKFDADPGPGAVFEDSVWVNRKTAQVECLDCFLK